MKVRDRFRCGNFEESGTRYHYLRMSILRVTSIMELEDRSAEGDWVEGDNYRPKDKGCCWLAIKIWEQASVDI